ncbi:MAG TPA: HAD family hydrolase [Candidatus Obscuribacterales bacterium]
MARKCQVPGRNFCAPNGKIAALFVDIDGTISVCEPYFEEAKQRFGYFMSLRGFDRAEAIKLVREIELAYIEKHGFERDALATAMVNAYRRLARRKGVRTNKFDRGICEDIGRSPYFREPELFPNAAAVLGRAHHNFRIIAVTIGNREAQKYKIRQAGLATVFDDIIITQRDDKAALVRAAIEDLNIDPRFSAFIGNSLRSDGACLKETNFIYLPMEPGWAFDKAVLPRQTGYEVFEVKDWRDAEERGINRLLRRRQSVGETDSSGSQGAHPKATPRPGRARRPAKRQRSKPGAR